MSGATWAQRWVTLHSQLARLGSRISSTSMDLRPCEVARITSGSTPISLPILWGRVSSAGWEGCVAVTHFCQCLTTASVESMMAVRHDISSRLLCNSASKDHTAAMTVSKEAHHCPCTTYSMSNSNPLHLTAWAGAWNKGTCCAMLARGTARMLNRQRGCSIDSNGVR